MYLGAHVGIGSGLDTAVSLAKSIGCESMQIFAKSPQMWAGPPIAPEAAERFRAAIARERLSATAIHHGYLLNLASTKPANRRRSARALLDEIARAELLGVDGLILHPGAHVGAGVEAGIAAIVDGLNAAIEATPEGRVPLLLENAAGQGTTLCSSFEQIRAVLAGVETPARVAVALDTCHLFAAGIDFPTPDGYGAMIDRLRATVGLERVRAFHLNDAKLPLGSHRDRHENIGRGTIGTEGFRELVNDRRWARVPGYLETPLDDDGYARYVEDLTTLKGLRAGAPPAARRGPAAARRASG